MTKPLLANYWNAKENDGRAYKYPFEGHDQLRGKNGTYYAYSVTTALGMLDKPALRQWTADQVAARAATQPDIVWEKGEAKAFQSLRFAANHIRDDAASVGDHIHEYAQSLSDWKHIPPEPDSVDEEQIMSRLDDFWSDHTVEPIAAEATVWSHGSKTGNPYAGTLDLIAIIDGKATLLDFKSTRNVWETHLAQLCALGNADELLVFEGDTNRDDYTWKQACELYSSVEMPDFEQYAILSVRPDDTNSDGEIIPSHYTYLTFPREELEDNGFYDLFLGALGAKVASENAKGYFKQVKERFKNGQ